MKYFGLLCLHKLFLVICSPVIAQPLLDAKSFGYLLQNINIESLRDSSFDIIIMDYSSDGSLNGEFSSEQVATIINARAQRIVLSYLSIGEAEDYRFYFNKSWIKKSKASVCGVKKSSSAPTWLDKPNGNWCGNYKTKFWDRRWKKIIYGRTSGSSKSYLDRIIDAGFSGVYLDIIDGYEYWMNYTPLNQRRRSAAIDMAKFVIQISNYARVTRGKLNFVVVPQNGSGILNLLPTSLKNKYLNAIDAIGSEDTFYYGSKDENNKLYPQKEVIKNLKQFLGAGKKVLAVDYLTQENKINDFVKRSCRAGFIPQVSVRDLDSLSSQTVLGCD